MAPEKETSRGRAVGIGIVGLALAGGVVALNPGHSLGDFLFSAVVAGLGGWTLTHHVVALAARRKDSPDRWISCVTIAGAALGLLADRDLLVMLLGAFMARVFAEIARAFRGKGIYAQADEEKAEELTAFEQLHTPVQLPEWNQRLGARFIDTALALGATIGIAIGTGLGFVALLLWPLYETALVAWYGSTPGKALLGLRVVDSRGASKVPLPRAALRFALFVANLPFIFLQTRLSGDLLWSLDPRLSVMKPTYCGTVVVLRAEGSRLATLPLAERRRELEETVRQLRALPGPISRRAAAIFIVAFAALLVLIALFIPPPPD